MIKKTHKVGQILGISVSGTNPQQVLKKLVSDIKSGRKNLIVTPNPEIVLAAQDDNILFSILNKADITLPDGIGLVAAYKFLGLPCPKKPFERFVTLFVQGLGVGFSVFANRSWLFSEIKPVKGRDLAFDLIETASREGFRVFLLGGETGEAERAKKVLRVKFPGLKIASFQGPVLNSEARPETKKEKLLYAEATGKINKFSPDILFVGMTSPRQEKWLYRHLPKIKARVGMTVGGTFKYFSGERPVPPRFVNDAGLEWLYRLLTGSQNVNRIGRAVWEFPMRVFWSKFTS